MVDSHQTIKSMDDGEVTSFLAVAFDPLPVCTCEEAKQLIQGRACGDSAVEGYTSRWQRPKCVHKHSGICAVAL